MQIQHKSLFVSRITLDVIILIISFFLSVFIASEFRNCRLENAEYLLLFSLIGIWFMTSSSTGLYDEFRGNDFSYEIISIFKAVIYQIVSAIIISFVIKNITLSREFILFYSILISIFLLINRYLVRKVLIKLRQKGRNLRTLLIIGAGSVGEKFYNTINKNPLFGYEILGCLDDLHKTFLNGKYIGPISLLEETLNKSQVDDVIIALPNYAAEKLEQVITTCEKYTTRVKIIPDYFKFVSEKYSVSMFGQFPIISVRNDKVSEFHWRLLKRAFDTAFTLFLFIVLLSWLMPIIALIIKLDSKGPVLFKQIRWGRNNKKFTVFKFRTMKSDSKDLDDNGKYLQASKSDPRITRLGKFLRKTNLDELPQFINVLKGEMSLVGPRPHPIPLNLESKDNVRHYMLRHLVKPGITGWAQVNGCRGDTKKPGLMEKRVQNDLWYIENWTFWLDIQIIILTIWRMIKGDPHAY